MIKILRSGGSDTNLQQIRLDLAANNVVNINTTGYKKDKPVFANLLAGKTENSGGRPGVNISLPEGVTQVVAVNKIYDQGVIQQTGRKLDMAINGDGFFRVGLSDGSYRYTRDGNFHLNADRQLVSAQGYLLAPEITLPEIYSSIEIKSDGRVLALDQQGNPTEIGIIPLYRFESNKGLKKMGENMFVETEDSGVPAEATPGENGAGEIIQESLEMSNVDLAEEMAVVIEAQRAYQAGAQSIKTVDQMWGMTNNLRK